MKRLIVLISVFAIFYSCGISDAEYNKVVNERDSLSLVVNNLHQELEELQNGEERITGLIENAISEKKYIITQHYINILREKHPSSSKISYYNSLKEEIEEGIKNETILIEKHKKDSIRLANIDNLGIWEIDYYVDDFKEKTKSAYITAPFMSGTFSNSATTNSPLRVRFIIDLTSIRIQLYEYAGNHPIKGEGTVEFKIKDSEGETHTIKSFNGDSGNNTLNSEHNQLMLKILSKGGTIKFVATSGKYTRSEYNFTIQNADFFENALLKLKILAENDNNGK